MLQTSLARLLLWPATSAVLAVAGTARAAPPYPQDDVIQIEVGEPGQVVKRDVAIWLPTGAGPHPLVLFSHGVKGCKTQSSALMRALADHGMLVAAPDHADHVKVAQCETKPSLQSAQQELLKLIPDNWSDDLYADRRDDFRKLRAALQDHKVYSGSIDSNRVALVGHSLGGYTVLGLAGAWPSWKMDGITAVVALAPAAHPFSNGGKLSDITVPVLYEFGTKDEVVVPAYLNQLGIFDDIVKPACNITYQDADHFAWTDLQSQFQEAIAASTVAFLNEAFKGGTPTAALLKAAEPSPSPPAQTECK